MFSLFRLFIGISALGSFVTVLPALTWWLEVNRNFGAYYLFAHLGALVVIPLAWRWSFYMRLTWGVIIASLALYQALPIVPFLESEPQASSCAKEEPLRVFYTNVQQDVVDRGPTKELIAEGDFDVVGLLETNSSWLEGLSNVTSQYKYRAERPSEDKFGLVLYSKYPFKDVRPPDFFGEGLSVLSASVLHPKIGEVEFVLMHAAPPLSTHALASNKLLFRRVSTFVRHLTWPTVVMGDFNATPHSKFYSRMVDGAELSHVFWGHGFPRTWNAYTWGERFMLDHVLLKGGLEVSEINLSAVSDHFAYSAALSMPICK